MKGCHVEIIADHLSIIIGVEIGLAPSIEALESRSQIYLDRLKISPEELDLYAPKKYCNGPRSLGAKAEDW